MSYNEKRNRIEYMVTCVGDFAHAHKMTPADAFSFLKRFKGLDFLVGCYDVEHSLSIDTAVSDLGKVCMRNGGCVGMILYHGSNVGFKEILLSRCSPHKDFGRGFYLSDSYDVAFRMARRAVRQYGGRISILVYEIDEAALKKLSHRRFAQPGNRTWARFVLANRNPGMKATDHNRDCRYDWVVGPIADDGLAFLFKMFERGYYTLAEVLRKMQFHKKLTTQYSFHTSRALALLKLKEVRYV